MSDMERNLSEANMRAKAALEMSTHFASKYLMALEHVVGIEAMLDEALAVLDTSGEDISRMAGERIMRRFQQKSLHFAEFIVKDRDEK